MSTLGDNHATTPKNSNYDDDKGEGTQETLHPLNEAADDAVKEGVMRDEYPQASFDANHGENMQITTWPTQTKKRMSDI